MGVSGSVFSHPGTVTPTDIRLHCCVALEDYGHYKCKYKSDNKSCDYYASYDHTAQSV